MIKARVRFTKNLLELFTLTVMAENMDKLLADCEGVIVTMKDDENTYKYTLL